MKKVILRGSDSTSASSYEEYHWEPFTGEDGSDRDDVYDIPDGLYDWWSSASSPREVMQAEVRQMITERVSQNQRAQWQSWVNEME